MQWNTVFAMGVGKYSEFPIIEVLSLIPEGSYQTHNPGLYKVTDPLTGRLNAVISMLIYSQIASEYTTALEKLISAYSQIASFLPRFDRLSAAFEDDHGFQQALGLVYSDIVEFHRKTYTFVRRPGP